MDGEKRYCTIEESIIESCKEVNLMRKGLKPKKNDWRTWLDQLEKELEEEEVTPKNQIHKKRRVAL